MKLYRLSFLVLLFASFVVASMVPSKSTAETMKITSSPKVKALLEERRDVLAKRIEVFEAQFHNAKITRIPVLNARDDLFAAELELAETRKNRIELLKSRVANLKAIEESHVALSHVALKDRLLSDESDILLARSRRLLAEIELERTLSAE